MFRVVRKVRFDEEDSFDLAKSDNLSEMLFDNLKYLGLRSDHHWYNYPDWRRNRTDEYHAGIGYGTHPVENGVRMALGANRRTIRNQFLTEAVVIGQIGGIVGIVFGISIGNILSFIIGSGFIVPWTWIILGVVLCFGVAVLSGIIPATRAARLDPRIRIRS